MSEPDAVFAYGTLQVEDVMVAVTGRRFDHETARLPDYRRRRIRDRSYPGIVPASGDETRGVVFRGIDAETLARLDVFEGELYERLRVYVCAEGERLVRAWVYVVAERYRERVSDEPWSLDEFLRVHGEAFLAECRQAREEGVR